MCLDHEEVQKLIGQITDRRIITYGTNPQADVKAMNITTNDKGSTFDVKLQDRTIKQVYLPMPGHHNLLNCLAAIATANELKISDNTIKRAFENFSGVKRRFTKVGEVGGISVIDDYGHHPTEIAATLQAARQVCKGRVIAVVQPHRFTRVRDLFEDFCKCFNNADKVMILDIYPAGEEPIEGVDKDHLADGIRSFNHKDVEAVELANLPASINEYAQKDDYIICLGAGSITNIAAELPEQLKELRKAA